MKAIQFLAAGAAALLCVTAAQADVVIHITGATAFRTPAVNNIISLMGGSGSVKSAWKSGGSATSRTNATESIFQGTIAPYGTVTVKCFWSGSAAGVRALVSNLDITNRWMSVTNLPANPGNDAPVASPSYALDFPGETLKADVSFSDAKQVSTGYTSSALVETKLGVIPFEWVVGNISAASDATPTPVGGSPITNITPLQAQAVLSGGAPLSQFTGVTGDVTTPVYALGRDADSGTRISCLAETGVGVFGSVQHIQPTITGSGASAVVADIRLWPAATVLDVFYPIGNSGYASGGTLATALSTPGVLQAATSGEAVIGNPIPANQQVNFGTGHLIAYVGRSDANAACAKTTFANNNAHRISFNGYKHWNDPVATNGSPASYNDNLIQEGLYQAWEFEWLSYRSTYGTTSPDGKAIVDLLAAQIITTPTSGAILLGAMSVTKAVEGGVITHL